MIHPDGPSSYGGAVQASDDLVGDGGDYLNQRERFPYFDLPHLRAFDPCLACASHVIGPDGRCKECGLSYKGGPSENIEQTPADAKFEEVVEDEDVDEDVEDFSEDGDEKTITDLEWEQRTLCSDESCIGVIGPDGRCKECGKPQDL